MYVIIENGGKQYKAVEGGYIEIDLLPDEVGKKKTFDKVLFLSTDGRIEVGDPYVNGVSVDTTITSHFKGPKVIIFKYRAKQRYRVKTGHRQKYSRVLIDSIAFPGKSAAAKKSTDTSTSKKTAPAKAVKSTTAVAKKTTSTKAKSTTKVAKKTTSTKAKSNTSKKTSRPWSGSARRTCWRRLENSNPNSGASWRLACSGSRPG